MKLTMDLAKPPSHIVLFLTFSFAPFLCSEDFNISQILSKHPAFSTFNHLLTKTQLVKPINQHKTITVLVFNDDAAASSSLSEKPQDLAKRILSAHVILDYFDIVKLHNLKKRTALATNLFQTSGDAIEGQGFLNATVIGGKVFFGSAIKGGPLNAQVVKGIEYEHFNISVLEISEPVYIPGLDPSATRPPPERSQSHNKTRPGAPSPSPLATPPQSPRSSPVPSPGPTPSPAAVLTPNQAPASAPAPGPTRAQAAAPGALTESPPADVEPEDGGDRTPAPSESGSSRTEVVGIVGLGLGVMFGLVSHLTA